MRTGLRFRLLFQGLLLIILLSLPVSLPYLILFGAKGVWIIPLATLVAFFYLGTRTERVLQRLLKTSTASAGLLQSLKRACTAGASVPSVVVFKNPSPQMLVARSYFGSGTIYLSQGLVTQLNEPEIRAILRRCVEKLDEPGLKFQGAAFLLSALLLQWAPKAWCDSVFQRRRGVFSAGSALPFLILYSVAQLLVHIASFPVSSDQKNFSDPAYGSAMHKIRVARGLWDHLSLVSLAGQG